MSDEQQTPALEAGDEAVSEDQVSASEATENTEGQEEAPPAEEKSEDSPSKQRRERRRAEMDRLRQENREASEKLEAMKARLAKIEADSKSQPPPKESDFTDYNEYLVALASHKAGATWDDRQARQVREETEAQQEHIKALEQREAREAAESWSAQVADARDRYADFDKVALSPDVPIGPQMAQIIASSDVGADVAYFLGSNKAEAARIAKLNPLDMARAIGGIEARLSAPASKTQTRAPDPITPVKPSGTAAKDPAKMTYPEFRAWREAGGSF